MNTLRICVLTLLYMLFDASADLIGHLKPLGQQRPPTVEIKEFSVILIILVAN